MSMAQDGWRVLAENVYAVSADGQAAELVAGTEVRLVAEPASLKLAPDTQTLVAYGYFDFNECWTTASALRFEEVG